MGCHLTVSLDRSATLAPVSVTLRRLVAPVLLATALVLSGCGGGQHPAPTPTPTEATSAPTTSPAPSATGPLPAPGAGATLGWTARRVALTGGRSFFVGLPTCTGSAGCAAWLHYPRKLIIWAHGFGQPETLANAKYAIGGIFAATGGDAIPVFAVSEGGSRGFDADLCCTFRQVDELGYLDAVIGRAAKLTPIDTTRVGIAGASNGGMLATKAICTQPDVFKAIAIWGASWKGSCDSGPVTIGHWHGDADVAVPLRGGASTVAGHPVQFPPADWLRGRLAPGSEFTLTTMPGVPHFPVPLEVTGAMLAWLDQRL